MPHFVIHCSESIVTSISPDELMQQVYDEAQTTGLFTKGDIKVRVQPFAYYKLGDGKEDFIHIFGNIMEGRTADQKKNLSRKIISMVAY